MTTVRRIKGAGPLLLIAMAYAAGLALLVFGPWGDALNRTTVWLYVFFRSDVPVAPAGALPEHYGVVLNILLFVPLGAALALVLSWAWWWLTLLAAVTSATIEVVQGLWLDRIASWWDVAANTAGALVGAVTVSLLARARRRAGSRPGSGRRP